MSEQAPDATRWEGYTHQELYRLLHEGAGPAASAEPSRRWAGIAGTLTEIGQDLQSAIDKSGSGWSGRAAGRAYDRLSGLVGWANITAASAGEMRKAVESQAEHLAKARADMPKPDDAAPVAADPTTAPAVQVISATTDSETAEASAAAGEQRAFEVMTAYELNTDTTTGAMAAFNAPAEVITPGDVHRRTGTGVVLNTPALSVGLSVPPPQDHQDHGYSGGGGGDRGGSRDYRDDWGTHGAAAEVDFARRPLAAPSSFTVAAPMNEPLFGIGPLGLPSDGSTGTGGGRGSGGRVGGAVPGLTTGGAPGIGSGSGLGIGSGGTLGLGGGGGGNPTTGGTSAPGIGTAAGHGPTSADFQSAAAGQAAAAAGTPAAATPGAAAGTGGGAQDGKTPLRRFGMDAIGSGQWFAETQEHEQVRGASPNRRRREFRDDDQPVTESVSIDGEEHRLPPTVIGE
jgi:hypothetical protein